LFVRGLGGALVCLGAAWSASAAETPGLCETEAAWVRSEKAHHYLMLSASRGVFYDRSGPSIVMLMKTDASADEVEMGAVGIYADEQGRAVFGTVPWKSYDALLREPAKGSQNVMLRLEINGPQYERVLGILRSWERRARENELLYRNDFNMNNILLVKQATEELNRCGEKVNLYKLDWSLEDRISDDNARSLVPFLVFEELKRRNARAHVSDDALPDGLLALAGAEPLPAHEVAPVKAVVRQDRSAHEHHAHGAVHTHEHHSKE
jgi:hypothetical protein